MYAAVRVGILYKDAGDVPRAGVHPKNVSDFQSQAQGSGARRNHTDSLRMRFIRYEHLLPPVVSAGESQGFCRCCPFVQEGSVRHFHSR